MLARSLRNRSNGSWRGDRLTSSRWLTQTRQTLRVSRDRNVQNRRRKDRAKEHASNVPREERPQGRTKSGSGKQHKHANAKQSRTKVRAKRTSATSIHETQRSVILL